MFATKEARDAALRSGNERHNPHGRFDSDQCDDVFSVLVCRSSVVSVLKQILPQNANPRSTMLKMIQKIELITLLTPFAAS